MRDPLISVIIPVYQAEKTIERCVSSIVSHRAPIEIVCVDDGSKDQSLGILQRLARDNDRLNIFHQDNAGAAAARNKGLSVARGEYVMFCDADDAYFEDTIDLITEDIEKYQADYIVFGRQSTTLDNHVVTCHKSDRRTKLECTWYGYMNDYLIQHNHSIVVYTRVFKKSIIDQYHVVFGPFLFAEDLSFLLAYLPHSVSFVEDYRACYRHFELPGSICQKSYDNHYDLNVRCINQFIENNPAEAELILPFVINYKFKLVIMSFDRIINGIDADSFKKKKELCEALFRNDDLIGAVHQRMAITPQLPTLYYLFCQCILHRNFYAYYFLRIGVNKKNALRDWLKK